MLDRRLGGLASRGRAERDDNHFVSNVKLSVGILER